jgi:hypothetical protein
MPPPRYGVMAYAFPVFRPAVGDEKRCGTVAFVRLNATSNFRQYRRNGTRGEATRLGGRTSAGPLPRLAASVPVSVGGWSRAAASAHVAKIWHPRVVGGRATTHLLGLASDGGEGERPEREASAGEGVQGGRGGGGAKVRGRGSGCWRVKQEGWVTCGS